MKNSKKAFVIFTAIFLGIVLLAGIAIGAVSIIRDSRSVMNYKGVYLYEGVANYLTASFKNDFVTTLGKSGVDCRVEGFWESDAGDGKTYARLLEENTEKYLKSVLVSSYLFDRNTRLSKDDKAKIDKYVNEVLDYKAGADVDKFNEIGESMGFTFRDFKKAAKLLYKSQMAETVIFGFDGAALASGSFSAECNEYYQANYSRAMLLFIRTDGKLVINPDNGKQDIQDYTPEEWSAVEADIAKLDTTLTEGLMNEDVFRLYTGKYPTGNTANDTYGYYFSASSAYSQNFAKEGGREVVKFVLSASSGATAKIAAQDEDGNEIGYWYVYVRPLEEGAYSSYLREHFFEDFYMNAAPEIYAGLVESYFDAVKVKKKYNPSFVVSQPHNYELGITFG